MKFYTSLNILGRKISHVNLRKVLESICYPLLSVCDVHMTQVFHFSSCLSMFCSSSYIFFLFSPTVNVSVLWTPRLLLSLVYLMVSYAVLAVGNFLTGFPPCFLSTEFCFGMGQEVVFKLTAFWSLIFIQGHAFLLIVIWISL